MGLFSSYKANKEFNQASQRSMLELQKSVANSTGNQQMYNEAQQKINQMDNAAATKTAVKDVGGGAVAGAVVAGPVGAVVGGIAGLAKNLNRK